MKTFCVSLSLFCLCFLSSAFASEEFVAKGWEYMEKKDYGRAIIEFNKAYLKDPENIDAIVNRGIAYASRGQDLRALEDYFRALHTIRKDDPEKSDARIDTLIGFSLFYLQKYKEAIFYFEKGLVGYENNAQAYYGLGMAYNRLQKYKEAMRYFYAALSVNPKMVSAYAGRADTYNQMADFTSAIQDYTTAIKLDRRDGYLYFLRGKSYACNDDKKRAVEDFKQACKKRSEVGCQAYYLPEELQNPLFWFRHVLSEKEVYQGGGMEKIRQVAKMRGNTAQKRLADLKKEMRESIAKTPGMRVSMPLSQLDSLAEARLEAEREELELREWQRATMDPTAYQLLRQQEEIDRLKGKISDLRFNQQQLEFDLSNAKRKW